MKRAFVLSFLFCLIAVKAIAGDVVRGQELIDQGDVYHKSVLTVIPFAAYEYGINGYYLQDFDSDIEATSGLAFGFALAKTQDMVLSFYTRQPLASNKSVTRLFGVAGSKSSGKNENFINSYSLAGEYYNWSDEPDSISKINIDQVRLRAGWVGKDRIKNRDKLYRNLGAGLAIGYGNLEMTNVYNEDRMWRLNNGSRMTGDGGFWSIGLYLEGGVGYRLTQKMNIDCKLVLEGLTSQNGAEINGTDVVPIATNAYVRAGLTYLF